MMIERETIHLSIDLVDAWCRGHADKCGVDPIVLASIERLVIVMRGTFGVVPEKRPAVFKLSREGAVVGEFGTRDEAVDAAIMAIRTGAHKVEIENPWDARKP